MADLKVELFRAFRALAEIADNDDGVGDISHAVTDVSDCLFEQARVLGWDHDGDDAFNAENEKATVAEVLERAATRFKEVVGPKLRFAVVGHGDLQSKPAFEAEEDAIREAKRYLADFMNKDDTIRLVVRSNERQVYRVFTPLHMPTDDYCVVATVRN